MNTPKVQPGSALNLAVVLWICAVCGGSLVLVQYSNKAAVVVAAPSTLPSGIADADDKPYSLFMFVHPKCPCTRASLRELNKLVTTCRGKVSITIFVYHATTKDDSWSLTDLWESAQRISGAVVRRDPDAYFARKMMAHTSGQVLLYGDGKQLLYNGGITAGRGHEGDNIGRDSLEAIVLRNEAVEQFVPVFGCTIARYNEVCGGESCQQ